MLSGRTVRLVDAFLIVWAIAWVVLAISVSREVQVLRGLSTTVVKAGVAVRTTGTALGQLRSLPIIGRDIGPVANQAREAGRSAIVSGRDTRDSVDRLALLLGIAVGGVPTLPLLALYVPWRLRWSRDRRAIQRALAEDDDPRFEDLLAQRAIAHCSYEDIREILTRTGHDRRNGDRALLANQELRRLGIHERIGEPTRRATS